LICSHNLVCLNCWYRSDFSATNYIHLPQQHGNTLNLDCSTKIYLLEGAGLSPFWSANCPQLQQRLNCLCPPLQLSPTLFVCNESPGTVKPSVTGAGIGMLTVTAIVTRTRNRIALCSNNIWWYLPPFFTNNAQP
jgi:hypothetical protein